MTKEQEFMNKVSEYNQIKDSEFGFKRHMNEEKGCEQDGIAHHFANELINVYPVDAQNEIIARVISIVRQSRIERINQLKDQLESIEVSMKDLDSMVAKSK